MSKRALSSPALGPPFGTAATPFSLGIVAEGKRVVFVSGMAGIDGTWKPVSLDVTAQAEQTLENIKAILSSAGGSLDDVVKVTIFLTSVDDYAKVNAVRARYFRPPYPASSCVEVSKLVVDGLRVEIEAIAVLDR